MYECYRFEMYGNIYEVRTLMHRYLLISQKNSIFSINSSFVEEQYTEMKLKAYFLAVPTDRSDLQNLHSENIKFSR